MISYHLQVEGGARMYARDFKLGDTRDLQRIAKCMQNFVWSPCVWRDGIRLQTNFESALFCVLDFDDGELTLKQAIRNFSDMRCIIGTTKSHGLEKNGYACDRFRVLFEWAVPIYSLRIYRYAMNQIMKDYPCDKSCKDGARFFYPCREIVYINEDKDLAHYLEVPLNVPNEFENYAPIKDVYKAGGIMPKSVLRKFGRSYRLNQRNTAVFGFAKDLASLGFGEQEIFTTIKSSHIYKTIQPLEDTELSATIKNGIKAVTS